MTTVNRYTRQFDSIAALADFVAANQDKICSSIHSDVFDSDAQMDFSEAIERGKSGGYWPKGAANVKPIEMDLSKIEIHGLDMPRPEAAVMGYRPNVAAYLAGSPLSMVRMSPYHQPNRLIRVAVAVGKQFNVDAETSYNRGSGILSVLNALHAAGFSIELWALWRNQVDNKEVSIETLIKDSTDSYSPDSIAFSLCNDAFQRRLNWAALGIFYTENSDNKNVSRLVHGGLGSGKKAEYEDFDLHYDWLQPTERWTKEGSADKARGIAEVQLNANLATTGL